MTGKVPVLRRHGAIGGDVPIAGGNAHLAGFKAFAVGMDHGLRRNGPHGRGETGREARSEHFAAVDRLLAAQAAPIVLETVHAFTPQESLPGGPGNRTFIPPR